MEDYDFSGSMLPITAVNNISDAENILDPYLSDGITVYQTTPGPSEVIDQNGASNKYDYCQPDYTPLVQDVSAKCLVGFLYGVTNPEGDQVRYKYAGLSIVEERHIAKPGTGLPDLVRTASYDCLAMACRLKPTVLSDFKGQVTNITYDTTHGGVLSEMAPAPSSGAARPLRLTAWMQRYGWVKNTSGTLVQQTSPIWVKASETQCQTVSGTSPAGICDGNAPSTTTAYEYGASGTWEALLMKGVAVSSGGITLRTCYTYDQWSHKISETSPNANLTSCP